MLRIIQLCCLFVVIVLCILGATLPGQPKTFASPARLPGLQANVRLQNVTQLDIGYTHTCALQQDGTVQCWGFNGRGALGDGTTTDRATPVAVQGLSGSVSAIATGDSFTCAVLSSASVQCWGANNSGQLGDGTTVDRATPVTVQSLSGAIRAIAPGYRHICVLLDNGSVQCWGDNSVGQLGDGTTENRLTPVTVQGLNTNIKTIVAGGYHTCALLSDGTLQCWGGNGSWQLGDGTTENRLTPVTVQGLGGSVNTVTAAEGYTCVVLNTGGVQCWGQNDYLAPSPFNFWQSQPGSIHSSTPVTVEGFNGIINALAAGLNHTCALLDNGSVQCWGWNGWGQVGNVATVNIGRPFTVVEGLRGSVTALAAGAYHTCALLNDSSVQCWGGNFFSQLGDGTAAKWRAPVTVVGWNGTNIIATAIAAGLNYTCAISSTVTKKRTSNTRDTG